MVGVRDIPSCRSSPVCRSRPLLMGPWNCTSLQTVPRLSLLDNRPRQQGGAGSSWGKVPKEQQCRAEIAVCRGSMAVLEVLGLSARLASAKKGLDVHLDNRGFVQSAPKHRMKLCYIFILIH